jgi:hypothetical protein
MSARLDNIEHLLERLAQNQSPRTRNSDLTIVEPDHRDHRQPSRFAEDLHLTPSEARIRASVGGNRVEPRTTERVAGLPKAELGPRAK